MKNWMAMGLVLILLLGLSACSREASLYEHGLDVVQLLSEMAQSEECIGVYTADEDVSSVVHMIGAQDHWAPKAVYAVSVSEEVLATVAELENMDVSEEVQAVLKHRVIGSLIPQINAAAGANALAATSICTAGKTFVCEACKTDVIYIYTYENAAPAAVTFVVGEDGTVSANGTFIVNENFSCSTAEDVKAHFGDIAVEVTQITQR
ncbi:MAG: hypothetical protein J6J43_06135 [Oscillospiraceae bacterium]|nr:hypothetical protein [Oscillospiraceae bacterium]